MELLSIRRCFGAGGRRTAGALQRAADGPGALCPTDSLRSISDQSISELDSFEEYTPLLVLLKRLRSGLCALPTVSIHWTNKDSLFNKNLLVSLFRSSSDSCRICQGGLNSLVGFSGVPIERNETIQNTRFGYRLSLFNWLIEIHIGLHYDASESVLTPKCFESSCRLRVSPFRRNRLVESRSILLLIPPEVHSISTSEGCLSSFAMSPMDSSCLISNHSKTWSLETKLKSSDSFEVLLNRRCLRGIAFSRMVSAIRSKNDWSRSDLVGRYPQTPIRTNWTIS